jgi:hypothetical protein
VKAVTGFAKRFGLFWWDFVVGDSLTLAVGTAAAIGIGAIIAAGQATLAEFVIPAAVAVTLVLSLVRR